MVYKIIENLLYTKTLSIFTLMIVNVQDFGLTMSFLVSGLKNPKVLNYYFLLFFLFLFIKTFLSMRILLFTWRIKNNFLSNNQINTREFKTKFYLFQMKFYSFLILYYILMHYFFIFHPILILVVSFIYVPQIISNLNIQVHQLDKSYILLFMLPRFFIYYYYRIYPFNIEGLKPYPIIMGISFLILVMSIIIIYLQGQYGSFFFLPSCLRWKQFNYFIKTSKLLNSLNESSNTHSNNYKQEEKGSFLKRIWKSWKKNKNKSETKSEIQSEYNSNQTDSSNLSIISKNKSLSNSNLDFIKMNSIEDSQITDIKDSSINQIESNDIFILNK